MVNNQLDFQIQYILNLELFNFINNLFNDLSFESNYLYVMNLFGFKKYYLFN